MLHQKREWKNKKQAKCLVAHDGGNEGLLGGLLGSGVLLGLVILGKLLSSAGGLDGSLASLSSLLVGKSGSTTTGTVGGVEEVHGVVVLQRVGLAAGEGLGLDGGADNRLNLIRVDDTANVGVVDHGAGQLESLLAALLGVGAVKVVELSEGRLGPDDEASEVASGSELEEVESRDGADVNRETTEGLDDTVILVVDNKGTLAGNVTAVTHLALSGADLTGIVGVSGILISSNGLESSQGLLGLLESLDRVLNNQGHFLNLGNAMSTSLHKSGESRGGKSGGQGVTALTNADLAVPAAPGLGGSEHASMTAHVTEGSLSGAGSTSSRNTRNTGDGATSSPGLSRVLVTSHTVDSVGLTLVLVHVTVDVVNNIHTDGGHKHSGHGDGSDRLASLSGRADGNNRTRGHFRLEL